MGNEMKTVIETLRNKSNLERFIRMGTEKVYGEEPPQIVEDRIAEELQMIRTFGYEEMLINTYLAVQVIKDAGEYHLAKGMAGASLVNYLLDITSVNPLPPHLRCPHCKYADFQPFAQEGEDKDASPSGFDLVSPYQKKFSCPKCGHFMVGDGHSLPAESFFVTTGEKKPEIELDVRPAFGEWFKKNAVNILGEVVEKAPCFTVRPNQLLKDTQLLERRSGILFRNIPIDGIQYNEFFESEEYKDVPVLQDIPEERIKGKMFVCFSDLVKLLGEERGENIETAIFLFRLMWFRDHFPETYDIVKRFGPL